MFKMHRLLHISALTLFCALVSVAQNIRVNDRGGFGMSVTGNQNVPKFEFWYKNGTRYYARLQHIFEVTQDASGSLNKVPSSELALPSLGWAFSDFTATGNESATFNLTATTNRGRFGALMFRFHVERCVFVCSRRQRQMRPELNRRPQISASPILFPHISPISSLDGSWSPQPIQVI